MHRATQTRPRLPNGAMMVHPLIAVLAAAANEQNDQALAEGGVAIP
jgi:hypothetical protein